MARQGQDGSDQFGRFRRDPVEPERAPLPPKPRFPHDVPIRSAGLSCDRKTLVALDARGFIHGWDATTTRRLYSHPLLDPKEDLQRITFSPDGRFVAVSPWSLPAGPVQVLDPRTGKEVRRLERGFSPSFSPDSELLACTDGPQLRRWSLKSGAELPRFPVCGFPLKWTAWSPANDVIAASGEEVHAVIICDVASGRRMFQDTVQSVGEAAASLAFSPGGKMLAIGSHWGIKYVWLSGTPHPRYESHEEYAVGQLKFSPDGHRMSAMSRHRRLLVWDVRTGEPLFTWAAYEVDDGSLEISEAGDVAIWIERGGMRLERIPKLLAGAGDEHMVQNLCFTPAGLVVTADGKGMIRMWDPATEKEVRRYQVPFTRMRAFSYDGNWAIFGGATEAIVVWDIANGKEVLKLDPAPAVRSIAISPDSSRLALGHADGTVSIWSIPDKKQLTRIDSEMSGITAVAWSADGKSLAWGDDTGVVSMAEGKLGKEPVRFKSRGWPPIRDLRFSPDGRTLAAMDEMGNQHLYTEPGIEPEARGVNVRQISDRLLPNHRWRASGCFQKTGLLRIVRDALSPDGSYIAGATRDGQLVIWEAPGAK